MKLENLKDSLVGLAAEIGPWLAPIPTAYLVGRAMIDHLDYPWPVAWVGGITLELLGLASISLALTFQEYNLTRRKSDPVAPTGWAVALVALYFVAAVLLTVAMDVVPGLVRYAPVLFPLISLAGAGVLALRSSHRHRLAEITVSKAERQRQRQSRKKRVKTAVNARSAAVDATVNATVKEGDNRKGKLATSERRERVRQRYLETGGDFSPTALARELGVSRQTVYNDLEALNLSMDRASSSSAGGKWQSLDGIYGQG